MSKKYVSGTWRYKMTVVVETPEGIKIGSAVRETSARRYPSVATIGGVDTTKKVKGEAVVVDLGKRGVLFAILGVNGSHEIVYEAFPSSGPPLVGKGILYYDGLYKEIGDKKAVLKRSMRDYPQLVTFTDIDDPKTVRGVHRKKLDEVFGEGVKLKEIYIQMTDEPVTRVVDEYLPKSFNAIMIDGWRKLSSKDKRRLIGLVRFKKGEKR